MKIVKIGQGRPTNRLVFAGEGDFSYRETMFGSAARRPLLAALMVLIALVLTLGFAGWMRHAGDLLLALGSAGLSWCL